MSALLDLGCRRHDVSVIQDVLSFGHDGLVSEWWRVHDASAWDVRVIEHSGSSANTWLQEPETEYAWLHKDTVIPGSGVEQGEDWAEAIATQVAGLFDVPCAQVRMCTRNGRRGSLSREITADGFDFYTGDLWLVDRDAPGYFPHQEGDPGVDPRRPAVRRPGHTLENFRRVLTEVGPPSDFRGDARHGFDVFVGYLLLDALIANRDRHTENWAVLVPRLTMSQPVLAPSFDHGGSLGYNVLDSLREDCLARDTVGAWVRKGTAHRLEHVKGSPRPGLVDVAAEALSMASPGAARWWREKVERIDLEPVFVVLRQGLVGPMSDAASSFVMALLEHNLGRLRDVVNTAG